MPLRHVARDLRENLTGFYMYKLFSTVFILGGGGGGGGFCCSVALAATPRRQNFCYYFMRILFYAFYSK